MVVFKRKQVVVLSLVLMIIVAGYLQYSYKQSSISTAENDKERYGEAVYVDNSGSDSKTMGDEKEVTEETSASQYAIEFFAQARLDRDVMKSRDEDALAKITEDANASNEIKAQAYEKMMSINENYQKEQRIETLIKEKGFNDVIALFGADGSIDIRVKSPGLTSADVAQIADIASRHANVDLTKIYVKNVY